MLKYQKNILKLWIYYLPNFEINFFVKYPLINANP